MRRIRLLLAVATALSIVLSFSAAPALADHDCIDVERGGEWRPNLKTAPRTSMRSAWSRLLGKAFEESGGGRTCPSGE